jgi:hypothetical protein
LAWLGRGWMERLWLDERKPAWMIYSVWYLQLVVVAVFDDTSLWYKIPTINNDDYYPYYFLWGRSLVQEHLTSFETIIHYNPTPLFFDVFSFLDIIECSLSHNYVGEALYEENPISD